MERHPGKQDVDAGRDPMAGAFPLVVLARSFAQCVEQRVQDGLMLIRRRMAHNDRAVDHLDATRKVFRKRARQLAGPGQATGLMLDYQPREITGWGGFALAGAAIFS